MLNNMGGYFTFRFCYDPEQYGKYLFLSLIYTFKPLKVSDKVLRFSNTASDYEILTSHPLILKAIKNNSLYFDHKLKCHTMSKAMFDFFHMALYGVGKILERLLERLHIDLRCFICIYFCLFPRLDEVQTYQLRPVRPWQYLCRFPVILNLKSPTGFSINSAPRFSEVFF